MTSDRPWRKKRLPVMGRWNACCTSPESDPDPDVMRALLKNSVLIPNWLFHHTE
ncbi:MAG: hypothetical protein R3C11_16845 [Planctomycetaceae bacterium]